MLPGPLRPTSSETVILDSGASVGLPKVQINFSLWTEKVEDNYNKPVLELNGEVVFAELAILRIFQNAGWEGAWIDTFRRRYLNHYWGDHPDVVLPDEKAALMDNIYAMAGSRSGCFDVLCWKNASVIFAESKRRKKDRIRDTQIRWLEAAMRCGLREESFLLVEWDFE